MWPARHNNVSAPMRGVSGGDAMQTQGYGVDHGKTATNNVFVISALNVLNGVKNENQESSSLGSNLEKVRTCQCFD